MIIAFIGFDGTGKSTIAQNLKNKISKETNKDIKIMHGFRHLFLDIIVNKFKNTHAAKKHTTGSSKKGILSYIWPFIVFIDSFLLYFYYKIKFRNKILILDRYFYDYIPSYQYLDIDKTGLLAILFKLIPKPNYIFSLTVEPEEAYRRKKEIGDLGDADQNYFFDQKMRYYQLSLDLEINVINTGKDTIEYITKKIFKSIFYE